MAMSGIAHLGEGDEMRIYSPTKANRQQTLLLVADETDRALRAASTLSEMGYWIFQRNPELPDILRYTEKAYMDAVLIDTASLMERNLIASSQESYHVGTGDAFGFLDNLSTIRDLPVYLVNLHRDGMQPFTLGIYDLVSLGAKTRRNSDGTISPFPLDDLVDAASDFHRQILKELPELTRRKLTRLDQVGLRLPDPNYAGQLGVELGNLVEQTFREDAGGGNHFFQQDSSSDGGVTRIDPGRTYPDAKNGLQLRTFHIKKGSPTDVKGFGATQEFLRRALPDINMNLPRGHHPGKTDYFGVLTFIIATSGDVVVDSLGPEDPLTKGVMDVLFNYLHPAWYAATHERVMQADHERARADLKGKQRDQLFLFDTQMQNMVGSPFPDGLQERFRAGVSRLCNKSISDLEYQLQLDAKARNFGLRTGKILSTRDDLYADYAPTGRPDSQVIARDISIWGQGVFGHLDTHTADVIQSMNDWSLHIPESDKADYLFSSLHKVYGEETLLKIMPEVLRQSAYKSLMKVVVTASHMQKHVARMLYGKIRDQEFFDEQQGKLQQSYTHFMEQSLKHLSLASNAYFEGWLDSGDLGVIQSKAHGHFAQRDAWFSIEKGRSGAQRGGVYGSLHGVVCQVAKNERFARLDIEAMKQDVLQGNFIRY
jgi:hypothetical protein